MTFMKGWRAGAATKELDPTFTQHQEPAIREAYNAGYELALANKNEASVFASLQYDYKPSILRLQKKHK